MEDRIKDIILDYLEKEYSNRNAIPGLLVSGIARAIDEYRWEIYSYTKVEYDLEDIDIASDNMGVDLTKDERDKILHYYQNSEYQDMDTLRDIVEEVIEEREKG